MGLSGSFLVVASGAGLTYQWSLNGIPIAGATAATYSTPATAFADNGESFSVTVSNSAGSVISASAQLLVTARAPKAGDLRFQQVDSVSTVNGYSRSSDQVIPAGCPAAGGGGISYSFTGVVGGPFQLVNDLCLWDYDVFTQPANADPLSFVYSGLPQSTYQYWLSQSVAGVPPGNDPGSVITAAGAYTDSISSSIGIVYVNGAHSTGFDQQMTTVDATLFQAAATQDGLHGRVITALYAAGTNITYFSYGWTGDAGTSYETTIMNATLDTTVAAAQALAAQGYIITATSSTQAADGSGILLVGTRRQGDTMPRPMMIGDQLAGTVDAVTANGYAIVGVIWELSGSNFVYRKYIGER